MLARSLISLVLMLALGACSTTSQLQSIPKSAAEFNQPLASIKAEFSDVSAFEKSIFTRPKPVKLALLEEAWGPASEVDKQWGEKVASYLLSAGIFASGILPLSYFIFIEATVPYPIETHHWYKENIHIEATVVKSVQSGYQETLVKWHWRQKTPASPSAASLVD